MDEIGLALRTRSTDDVPSLWKRYGLCIVEAIRFTASEDEFRRVVRDHWAVAKYLDENPEIAAQYKTDQSGEVKYFDVLKMAGR